MGPTLCWSVPYITVRDEFQLLFENVVLKSLKCFFQLDNQVVISLYLMEDIALCHSMNVVGLTPS